MKIVARMCVVGALLVTTSCSILHVPKKGAARELAEIANAGSTAKYVATYRYAVSGPLAEAVATRMQIAQRPPNSIREVDTVTKDVNGNATTLRSWLVHDVHTTYACTDYANAGVRCIADPVANGTFGVAKLDELFDTPRQEGAFENVTRSPRRLRIAGAVATCFEAVPSPSPTLPPVSSSPVPAFTPQHFSFELCYGSDGILLRGAKTIEGQVPSNVEARRTSVVEAVSVSHTVQPNDLKLPGAVASPSDLNR